MRYCRFGVAMADYAVVFAQAHYQTGWLHSKRTAILSNISQSRTCKRTLGEKNFLSSLNYPTEFKSSNAFLTNRKIYWKMSSTKYCFFRALTNEGFVLPEWMFFGDETLLAISVIFAYLAGVLRPSTVSLSSHKSYSELNSTSSVDSGRPVHVVNDDLWQQATLKLSGALVTINQHGSLDTGDFQLKYYSNSHPLSILAIDEPPRLRLLLITLEKLKEQVQNIPLVCELLSRKEWSSISNNMITALENPILVNWLQGESILSDNNISWEEITGEQATNSKILELFNRSAKAELYVDMLSFLRFGTVRPGSYYDAKILTKHGVKILDDLVVCLADGIASIYLDIISIDSTKSNELTDRGLVLCSLSTRALQRLRNEVSMNRWLVQYFDSVVSMFEDKFELYTITRKMAEISSISQTEKWNWWKWLLVRKTQSTSTPNYIEVVPYSISVKRTKELRALIGWRYYFSLLLEVYDIAMPFARSVFSKVSSMVSYFLVDMIGRSLGLIFSGIRSSLGWR